MRIALLFIFAACTTDVAPCGDDDVVGDDGLTVFAIQRPDSEIAVGAPVILERPELRITALGPDGVWVQEADASGLCDEEADGARVAFHAIRVDGALLSGPPARGQPVRIEGTVAEVAGRRRITAAQIQPLGGFPMPYREHCDRDGSHLTDRAFDGVLVRTSGETLGAPDATGAWQLATCFAPAGVPTSIGAAMHTHTTWAPGFAWVTGVLDEDVLQPRDADDILAAGDDACL